MNGKGISNFGKRSRRRVYSVQDDIIPAWLLESSFGQERGLLGLCHATPCGGEGRNYCLWIRRYMSRGQSLTLLVFLHR